MRKTLTINLGGTIYHINDDAYTLLENYLEALRAHFCRSKEGEEIVDDIELRISEIFSEHIARGVQVIDYLHVEQVIARMGKPEDMEHEASLGEDTPCGDSCNEEVKRKLFRNPDDKILGGVTAGLAAYLGWDITLLRLAMILLGFFVQGVLIAYIIAWVVIPMARTATDRLSMYGKAPNLENIGKSVTSGFEKVNDYVKSPESRSSWQRFSQGLVKIAGFLIKLMLILLTICCVPFLFILLIVCFALLLVSFGLLTAIPTFLIPLNEFFPSVNMELLNNFPGSSIVLAVWGIMLVCIPLVGIIQLIMSYFKKWEPMSMATRLILTLIWVFSLCGIVWFVLNQPLWQFLL